MSGESGDGGWRVEVLERSEDKLSLLFDGVPLHLLAALRRAVIEEVPTMAVSAVMFLENSSALHDEVLAHRLAMIPLRSEEALRKYRPPEECRECVDCENCTTKLYLDVKNVDLDELTVYSGDLKPEDPDVRPVHDRVPIVKLARGQSIALEAEARLGRGREHAKWSPVTVAVVVAVPRVTFDFSRVSEKELEECLGCLEGLSRELAERVRRELRGTIELTRFRNTSLLRYCEAKKCSGALKVTYSGTKRILKIEGTGALPCDLIVLRGIEELKRKVLRTLASLKEIEREGAGG